MSICLVPPIFVVILRSGCVRDAFGMEVRRIQLFFHMIYAQYEVSN